MEQFADLHIHTHYSDGSWSPQEVIDKAKAAHLVCVAITDHDTVDGVIPAMQYGAKHGIEVLSGVELSSEINGKDVHVLGYLFDHTDSCIMDMFNIIQNERVLRMGKMVAKLKELGIRNIELDEVKALAKSNALGRPHLARLLVEKGIVNSMQAAFDQYLAEGRPAYYPKYKQTPYEAIAMIRQYGGVAVLAHPMITQVDELIPSLVDAGLQGMEVHYAAASRAAINYYQGLARKYHLVETGGSDAHGAARPDIEVGMMKVPYAQVEYLKQMKGR